MISKNFVRFLDLILGVVLLMVSKKLRTHRMRIELINNRRQIRGYMTRGTMRQCKLVV